jgi:hypothetical protein
VAYKKGETYQIEMSPSVMRNVLSFQKLPSFGELFITLICTKFYLKYVKFFI